MNDIKLIIKNRGLKGYELQGRKKYTDEELLIIKRAVEVALINNRKAITKSIAVDFLEGVR